MKNDAKGGRKILAMIAARGGSKGLEGKNVRLLGSHPIISYSILPAVQSEYVDRTIVTTDSPEIAEIARSYGAEVPFLRPSEEASDTADLSTVYFSCLRRLYEEEEFEAEIVVYLMPTYPFKTKRDIDHLIEDILLRKYESSMFAHCLKVDELMNTYVTDDKGFLSPLRPDPSVLGLSWCMTNNSVMARTMPQWHMIAHFTTPDERDMAMGRHFLMQSRQGITNGQAMVHDVDRIRGIDIDSAFEFSLAETVLANNLFDFDGAFYGRKI